VNTVPIYDNQHNITGAIGMFQDITRRKELQQELINAYDILEDKVVERTKELRNANKALRKEIKERQFYQNKLRALTLQLTSTEERERRRLATGLHDNIVQELVFAKNHLGELLKNENLEQERSEIKDVSNLLGYVIGETRSLTFEISPPVLYELGLVPAIEWYAEEFKNKHGLEIIVKDDGAEKPVGEEVRNVLFQSVRELFTNVIKRAAAR
jgi:signal transduction histidine kinase